MRSVNSTRITFSDNIYCSKLLFGDFKKYKAREESQRNEIINSIKKQPKIDYSSLNRRVQDKSKSDIDTADMSELIGQIF